MIKIFRDKELLKGLGGSADYILETIENDTNLKEDVQELNLKIVDFQGIRRSYITTFCIALFLIVGPIMFFKAIMMATWYERWFRP